MSKPNIYEVSRLAPQTATITEFPDFVVVELQITAQIPFVPGFAMRTRDFAPLVSKWGNTDFVFEWREIPHEKFYLGVSNERLDDYVNHPQWMSSHLNETCSALWYAEQELFKNLVRDSSVMDGYLYDLNGDPVYRSFHIELGSNDFDTDGIIRAIRNHPKVQSFGVKGIPLWNRDSIGDSRVRFNYFPDADEFYELREIELKDSYFKANSAIMERLDLGRFSRVGQAWTGTG